jgi:uncharacterized protein (DUF362 family)
MFAFKTSESPFKGKGGKTKVFVAGDQGAYKNTIEALSNIDLSPAAGKKVLLKPNAGRLASPGDGVTTNPEVVAAAIDAFQEAGAEVAVGESPISGVVTHEAFEVTGIADVARERNCPLLDMDERPFIKSTLPEGRAIKELKLCPEVTEFDIIVSIPVMKMHMHTGVTLAMKNMKGCLWRRSKVLLHMLPPLKDSKEKPINVAIADMSWALRPHLSIIDGSIGMEGLGPSAGTPKPLGVVLVGADAYATDAVACYLMGTSAKDIAYLRLGAERGFGTIDMNEIEVFPDDWQKWQSHFELPPEKMEINYPGVTILDQNSCSACQSTLLLFLKRYGKTLFDYFPQDHINIAIGKGHDDVPEGTLCIGNCLAKHMDKGIFVKGCPPVGSEILSAISGSPSIDEKDGHSQNGD